MVSGFDSAVEKPWFDFSLHWQKYLGISAISAFHHSPSNCMVYNMASIRSQNIFILNIGKVIASVVASSGLQIQETDSVMIKCSWQGVIFS